MVKSRKNRISRNNSRKSRKMFGGRSNMNGDNAYCVRCKSVNSMVGAKRAVTKNGRNMLKGKCPKCGTKMNKFLKN